MRPPTARAVNRDAALGLREVLARFLHTEAGCVGFFTVSGRRRIASGSATGAWSSARAARSRLKFVHVGHRRDGCKLRAWDKSREALSEVACVKPSLGGKAWVWSGSGCCPFTHGCLAHAIRGRGEFCLSQPVRDRSSFIRSLSTENPSALV